MKQTMQTQKKHSPQKRRILNLIAMIGISLSAISLYCIRERTVGTQNQESCTTILIVIGIFIVLIVGVYTLSNAMPGISHYREDTINNNPSTK